MRYSIQDFSLANPIYINADVTFYTVSGGVKTATKATLYAGTTGTSTLANPQRLDSEGKFRQAVYIDEPVVATVSGLTIPDHDTGIIYASPTFRVEQSTGKLQYSQDSGSTWSDTEDYIFRNRSAWVTATAYARNDVITQSGNLYICLTAHTSGTFATDLAASKWLAVLDQFGQSSGAALIGYLPAGTGAVATDVQSKLRESVSVKDFGAVGDGVTDDALSLQSSLDNEQSISLGSAHYNCSQSIEVPPNSSISGSSGLSVKYNPALAISKISYSGTSSAPILKLGKDVNGVSASYLSNFVIEQTNTTGGVTGVEIGSGSDTPAYTLSTKLSNLLIYGVTGVGVANYGSWNCTVEDVLVHGKGSSNRATIGFHFDSTGQAATSCWLRNLGAEECTVGFRIGSTTSPNIYAYSSLENAYVDGCASGFEFLGDGTSTRVFHASNLGVEVVDSSTAILVDGANVVIDGLSLFANGAGFSYVIEARNNAVLTIMNADFIPQTGFGLTASTAIIRADNSVIRFINSDITEALGETVTTNGGRVDISSKDRNVFRNLERTKAKVLDLTVTTRNLTYSGFKQYNLSTTAGANQVMAGLPIISTTGVDDGEIITLVNMDSTYEFVLRTEDIVANTGVVKHPDNVSGSGVVIQTQDYAQFVKKADGKLYEIKRFA